ncbi:MAG: hypothetical protein ACXW61_05885 [Gemmatirosa sp.]
MRPILAVVPSLALLAAPLHAQVATFDDLGGCTPGNVVGTAVPNGYLGLSWTGAVVRDGTALTAGQRNGVVSAPCMAYSMSGSAEVTSPSPFTFNGGAFTSSASIGLALFLQGLRGNELVFQQLIFMNPAGPRVVDLRWTGLTRLRLASAGSEAQPQFVMDDLRFNDAAAPTVVPEPHGAFLLAGGLLALLGISARRRA